MGFALLVCDLPLQRPALYVLYDVDYFKPAFGQLVLAFHGKGSVIDSVFYEAFLFQLL